MAITDSLRNLKDEFNIDKIKQLKDEGSEGSRSKLHEIASKLNINHNSDESHDWLFRKISDALT